MRPVLLSVFGIDVQTYGVSKALAAWVAALLLGRAFERRGIGSRQQAYSLVMWSTVWGFAGAKVYYLLEQAPSLTMHDFGGMGFTWYGGPAAVDRASYPGARRRPPSWCGGGASRSAPRPARWPRRCPWGTPSGAWVVFFPVTGPTGGRRRCRGG